jgi:hypothetical protein
MSIFPATTRSAPAPSSERELLAAGKSAILAALPQGWSVEWRIAESGATSKHADATLDVRFPPTVKRSYQVELKRSLTRRDLMNMVMRGDFAGPDALLIARHIATPLQNELRARAISFADATGNVFLYSTSPFFLVSERGTETDPWRGPGRPVGTLKGAPAALLVRALADFAEPYTVTELAGLAGASIGATYRLVELLEKEALIEREGRGPITQVLWRQLLERWSRDYSFLDSNTTRGFLEPRGIDQLRHKLRQGLKNRYAVTGSLAAQPFAPYAEPRLAMLYADNIDETADELGLRPATSGVNVILASQRSSVVFERTSVVSDITLVAPSQASVDLLTGPGRNPGEGEALLDWMERNIDEWRQQPRR